MTPQEAGQLAWKELHQGRPFPAERIPISSPEEGYRIQLEVLALHVAAGEAPVGWKVGLTAKATQQYLGHYERIFGYLLASGELQTDSPLAFGGIKEPLLEPELCVVLEAPLQGPGVSIAQARAAIGGVFPAVEIVEVGGRSGADLPLVVADNSAHRHFFTGPLTSLLPPEVALQATSVEITINGEVVEWAGGHEVIDGAEGSVAWLANKLSEFGRSLEPGDKIMTGSFTKPYPCKPGDRIEARFDPFGSVSFEVGG